MTLNVRIVPRLLAAAVLVCCAAQAEETESQRFRAFLDHAYEGVVQRSPILASEFGEHVGEDRWDDVSEAGLAADAKAIREQLDAVKSQFSYDSSMRPASCSTGCSSTSRSCCSTAIAGGIRSIR